MAKRHYIPVTADVPGADEKKCALIRKAIRTALAAEGVDFPCEVIAREQLASRPERVDYTQAPMRMRHYGRIVQQMVEKVRQMPQGPERDEVILLVANQMKKQMLAVNPDGVEDARIFKDLADMTRGEIRLNPAETSLHQFRAAPVASAKSKKKKRR